MHVNINNECHICRNQHKFVKVVVAISYGITSQYMQSTTHVYESSLIEKEMDFLKV